MADVLWELTAVTLPGDAADRLHNISLQIDCGVTAVTGYSGAGKTSLLAVLAGMESAGSAAVTFSLPTTPGHRFSLPLYWVPQDAGLWPHLTAGQHLDTVAGATSADRQPAWLKSTVRARSESVAEMSGAGAETPEFTDLTDNLLTQFDLYHRRHAFPGELSKGEQSRLSLARCLAADPAVMVMDEPLGHVDPIRRPQYWRIIREYLSDTGASLVFSTHEPDAVIRESQNVICLSAGQVIYSGSTAVLYRSPPTAEAGSFLGPVNWFENNDLALWIPACTMLENAAAVRPEAIHLQPTENGPLQILSFQFSGSYAETTLKHISTAAQKTIIHRPSGPVHTIGQLVQIEVRL